MSELASSDTKQENAASGKVSSYGESEKTTSHISINPESEKTVSAVSSNSVSEIASSTAILSENEGNVQGEMILDEEVLLRWQSVGSRLCLTSHSQIAAALLDCFEKNETGQPFPTSCQKCGCQLLLLCQNCPSPTSTSIQLASSASANAQHPSPQRKGRSPRGRTAPRSYFNEGLNSNQQASLEGVEERTEKAHGISRKSQRKRKSLPKKMVIVSADLEDISDTLPQQRRMQLFLDSDEDDDDDDVTKKRNVDNGGGSSGGGGNARVTRLVESGVVCADDETGGRVSVFAGSQAPNFRASKSQRTYSLLSPKHSPSSSSPAARILGRGPGATSETSGVSSQFDVGPTAKRRRKPSLKARLNLDKRVFEESPAKIPAKRDRKPGRRSLNDSSSTQSKARSKHDQLEQDPEGGVKTVENSRVSGPNLTDEASWKPKTRGKSVNLEKVDGDGVASERKKRGRPARKVVAAVVKKEKKPLACDICDQKFKTPSKLENHKYSHTGFELECEHCRKKCKSRAYLNVHVRQCHTSEKPFRCDFGNCGKTFASVGLLESHKRSHGPRNLVCEVCSKAFKFPGVLKTHLKTHDVNRQKHVCPVCGIVVVAAGILKTHMRAKHSETKESYKCEQCDRTYTYSYDYQIHMRKHRGEKNKVCDACGERFYSSSDLARHKKYRHAPNPGERVPCGMCDATFTDRINALRHMRIMHKKDKKLRCEVCGFCCTFLNELKRHKLIHTEVKPFLCGVCGKTFRRNFHLKQHSLTHKEDKEGVQGRKIPAASVRSQAQQVGTTQSGQQVSGESHSVRMEIMSVTLL